MKKVYILLAIAGILIIGWFVESLFHGDERRVAATVHGLAQAVEREDPEAWSSFLSPEFSYDSRVSWLGKGDLETARRRMGDFWRSSKQIAVLIRDSEFEVAGRQARVSIKGNLKFQSSETGALAIYKFRATLQLADLGEVWKISRVEVLELAPGLF